MRCGTFAYWAGEVFEIKKTKARSTCDNYERALRLRLLPYFGKLKITDITLPLIQKYFAHHVGRKFADDIKHLNQILKFARNSGEKVHPFVIKNPDIKVGRGKLYSEPEIAALLREASGDYRLVILMALTMGMRQHEILGLSWSSIDIQNAYIYLQPIDQKTRTTVDREFPINKEVYTFLCARRRTGAKVFQFRHRQDFNNVWRKIKKRAGVKGRFHDLRHTALSRMLAANISPLFVQKLLGVSPQVMRRYSHISKKIAMKAVNL